MALFCLYFIHIFLYFKNVLQLFITERLKVIEMQRFGIKYPFSSDNEEGLYLDLNNNRTEGIKSQVLHVIFTPKGQKLRDPEFGTSLINYIFTPKDDETFEEVKAEISEQIKKYVPQVNFRNIDVYENEEDDNSIVVIVEYSVNIGNKEEITKVGIKL